jgi:hypothetical protein
MSAILADFWKGLTCGNLVKNQNVVCIQADLPIEQACEVASSAHLLCDTC